MYSEQVIKNLRRPDVEAPSREQLPAGFQRYDHETEAALEADAQRKTNAKIIRWILTPWRDPTSAVGKPVRDSTSPVWELSKMEHGCWIIQQALDVADLSVGKEAELAPICQGSSPKALIAKGLTTHVNEALQHKFANHVLQKCIEVLPRDSTKFILEEIACVDGAAVKAAKHQCGCRVLQRLIEHFWDSKEELVPREFLDIVEMLIKEDVRTQSDTSYSKDKGDRRFINDKFANFVFQSLLEHGACDQKVVEVLKKDTLTLAKLLFSGHVVSQVLEIHEHRETIVQALIGSEKTTDVEKFRRELEHTRYGSFVYKQVKKLHPEWFQAAVSYAQTKASSLSSGKGRSPSSTQRRGGKGKPRGRGKRHPMATPSQPVGQILRAGCMGR